MRHNQNTRWGTIVSRSLLGCSFAVLGASMLWQPSISLGQSFPPSPTPNTSFNTSLAPGDISPPPSGDVFDNDNEDMVETYNRGPLHEAFATPAAETGVETPVIPKQPPENVNEIPPDERPEGDNVMWIPGYWAWDEDVDDYLWVSGIWRDAPPGTRWLPGYWEQVDSGFRYIHGAWVGIEADQITYVPQPPETLEQGPNSPQPGDNYMWIPGSWSYVNNDYAWNPGYWNPVQQDYVWNPPSYNYCSAGYMYNPGYWDYPVYRRGFVFAPVRFNRPWRGGYYYRPRVVIRTWNNFFVNLFVRPRYGYYAFGNYYGPRYANRGFQPFVAFNGSRRGFYDPLFNYNRAVHGNTFVTQLNGWNNYYNRNENNRPPVTFREQLAFNQRNQGAGNSATNLRVSQRFSDVIKNNDAPVRLTKLDNTSRQNITRVSNDLRDLSTLRSREEISFRNKGVAGADAKLGIGKNNAGDNKAGDADAKLGIQNRNHLKLPGDKGMLSTQIEERTTLRQQRLSNADKNGDRGNNNSIKDNVGADNKGAGNNRDRVLDQMSTRQQSSKLPKLPGNATPAEGKKPLNNIITNPKDANKGINENGDDKAGNNRPGRTNNNLPGMNNPNGDNKTGDRMGNNRPGKDNNLPGVNDPGKNLPGMNPSGNDKSSNLPNVNDGRNNKGNTDPNVGKDNSPPAKMPRNQGGNNPANNPKLPNLNPSKGSDNSGAPKNTAPKIGNDGGGRNQGGGNPSGGNPGSGNKGGGNPGANPNPRPSKSEGGGGGSGGAGGGSGRKNSKQSIDLDAGVSRSLNTSPNLPSMNLRSSGNNSGNTGIRSINSISAPKNNPSSIQIQRQQNQTSRSLNLGNSGGGNAPKSIRSSGNPSPVKSIPRATNNSSSGNAPRVNSIKSGGGSAPRISNSSSGNKSGGNATQGNNRSGGGGKSRDKK